MKRVVFLFIVIFGIVVNSIAQQVILKGVVTVQNSRTYTGKTQYVKGAEVEHTNAKNAKTKDVTGNDGRFSLDIRGMRLYIQTKITVIPKGEYINYVVVNERELQDITLGREAPVSVYICKKDELEQRLAQMIGINMQKYEERVEKDKKRLQKEIEELKLQNGYLNARYKEIKDSLDIIDKNTDETFERIKKYAQSLVRENLDDRDDNYVKAYECFSRGELDSVSYYLSDHELDLKYQEILQLQEEAQKEKELAQMLNESARTKEEYAGNSLNELIKEWMLLARATDMNDDYFRNSPIERYGSLMARDHIKMRGYDNWLRKKHEKTMLYYEKAVNADTLNMDNILEYINYLKKKGKYDIYDKIEMNLFRCLGIYEKFTQEQQKAYLPDLEKILNYLGNEELNARLKKIKKMLRKQ